MPTERIAFDGHAGDKLAARLDLPAGGARVFALLAHCFTCGKDIAAARRIAQALTRAGIGVLMLIVSWASAYSLWRRSGNGLNPWLLRSLVAMTFAGWIATLAGWYTTEIGRQPWLVDGVLKTADAVTSVPAPMVLSTLVAYLIVYVLLLAAYISVLFYLARRAGTGDAVRAVTPTSPSAPVAIIPGE